MSMFEWLELNHHLFEAFDVGMEGDVYYDLTWDEALEKAREMRTDSDSIYDDVWIRPINYYYIPKEA